MVRLYLLQLHLFRGYKVCRVQYALVRGGSSTHRTFSNYIFTEIARYIEFLYTSAGWFDWTKPSLTTSLQGIQGAIWMRFKHIEPHRTFSNYTLARNLDFFHMSSGWFHCTEPSPATSLQGIQGVQGAICTDSGRFKHIEPHRTSSSQR